MTLRERLLRGLVIPAHPLALHSNRKLDERRQRALTRYYLASGAGGVAVGVHTTQFAIHDPEIGLLRPVLELTAEETRDSQIVKIAGVCGETQQAIKEAELAHPLGYDAGLLSLGGLRDFSVSALIEHARQVGSVLPLIGFYLQPSVGGRILPFDFWRQLAELESVVAIKIAPFNRYQTIDVVRAVADSGRADEIALYTGNDDNILGDLLTPFDFAGMRVRIRGGLLGHWAVWTSKAVLQMTQVRSTVEHDGPVSPDLLALNVQNTDANAALFDVQNNFRGCIVGIHEILRRQGLLAGRWCLDPDEDLSPGQMEEIDRVCRAYPHLQDNCFVREHVDKWLS
jgi:hypothetical protein